MRRVNMLIVMVFLSCLFLMFLYSTLNSNAIHRNRSHFDVAFNVTIAVSSSVNAVGMGGKTTVKQKSAPPLAVKISTDFRMVVPATSAYWNRKLYNYLRELDVGAAENVALSWHHCNALTMDSINTNIQDFSSYPPLYQDFLRGMECHDPPLLIDQPMKCATGIGENPPFLLFAIKSVPKNFEQRQAVRETWGWNSLWDGLAVRTVFLLGTSSVDDPDVGQMLAYEAQLHQDLLQWDFRDSFYNLTLKENAFIQWALRSCPNVNFIFKGDDDVFANTPAMLEYLRSLGPEKASRLYAGHVVTQASPFRDPKNKYYVPQSFYEGTYPPYSGGGGFLFSGALLQALRGVSQVIPFFPIDDVYSGMCFQAVGVSAEAHPGFQLFDIREQDRENACVYRGLLLVHQRSPPQIVRIWRLMHNPLLVC